MTWMSKPLDKRGLSRVAHFVLDGEAACQGDGRLGYALDLSGWIPRVPTDHLCAYCRRESGDAEQCVCGICTTRVSARFTR